SCQDFAPAFFRSVGLVVMPWMSPALSSGSMSALTAESQKMRGPLPAGCSIVFSFLVRLTIGIFSRRASMAALLAMGWNMWFLRNRKVVFFFSVGHYQSSIYWLLYKLSGIPQGSVTHPSPAGLAGPQGVSGGAVRGYAASGIPGPSGSGGRREGLPFPHK